VLVLAQAVGGQSTSYGGNGLPSGGSRQSWQLGPKKKVAAAAGSKRVRMANDFSDSRKPAPTDGRLIAGGAPKGGGGNKLFFFGSDEGRRDVASARRSGDSAAASTS